MNNVLKILPLYLLVVLINALLMPPIATISISNYLLSVALVLLIIKYRTNSVFLGISVIVLLNMCIRLLINYLHDGISISELMWSMRWLKLFTVGWSAYYVSTNYPVFFKNSIFSVFLIMALVNVFQIFEIDYFVNLYASSKEQIDLINNTLLDSRIFGTFINPNNNGLMMALFAIYFLMSNYQFKYHWFGVASVLLLLTQSRTALLAYLLSVTVILIIVFLKKKSRSFYIIIGALVVMGFFLFGTKFTNLHGLFDGTAYSSNSVGTRFDMIENVISLNKNVKWTGQGKVNDIPSLIGGSIDNEYAYVYLEYGLFGLLALSIAILAQFVIAIKQKVLSTSILLVLIMLIAGLTNLSFSNMEVGPAYIVLFVGGLTLPLAANQLYSIRTK